MAPELPASLLALQTVPNCRPNDAVLAFSYLPASSCSTAIRPALRR